MIRHRLIALQVVAIMAQDDGEHLRSTTSEPFLVDAVDLPSLPERIRADLESLDAEANGPE